MNKSILIADNHPVFLIGLKTLISTTFDKYYSIDGEATNVFELLSLIGEKKPDVLLTDYNLPGKYQCDGLQLMAKLRRNYPQLSIVVVTTLTNPGLIKSLLTLGVYAVINKQSLTTELIQCLKNLHSDYSSEKLTTVTDHADLSPRELGVVKLLVQGKSVNDIAAMLNLSKQTISTQKRNAMKKIGVSTNTDLLEYLHNVKF